MNHPMIRDETIAVLRAIEVRGPITVRELDALKVHQAQHGCKAAVHSLRSEHQFIEIDGFSGNCQRYSITPKGERFLTDLDRKAARQMGDFPEPRRPQEFKPLVVKAQDNCRPGALDFLKAPSLHNGAQIERKRPALICPAGVQVVGVHGGRAP